MILKSALPPPAHGPVHTGSLRGFAFFKCVCGSEFALRETNSFDGWENVKCPSCKRVERVQPDVGERYVMKRIRSDAARSDRVFELEFDWVKKMMHASCHYCGRKDQNRISVKSKVPGEYLIRDFRYNGLDRINNSLGYTKQNCVPCCFVCNRAKQSMTYEEFMDWIVELTKFNAMYAKV